MRIGGWIMFLGGIALGIMLLVLQFMGSGNGSLLRAFVFIALFIYTGWRMMTYGTGLVPSGSAAVAPGAGAILDDAAPAQPRVAPQTFTVEIPQSPVITELLREAVKKSARMYGWIIGIFGVLIFGLGVVYDQAAQRSPGGPPSVRILPIVALVSFGFVLLMGGIWALAVGLPARRELRGSVCLRTSGPVEVVSVWGGYFLRLADRAFLLSKGPIAALARMDWAVVDYGKYSHTILSVWDKTGANVYAAEGYRPEFKIAVDAPSNS